MRCPDCEKFVSYDTEVEPEEESAPEVEEGLVIRASYRRVLACGECGTELKAATLDVEDTFVIKPYEVDAEDKPAPPAECGDEEHEWNLGELSVEPTTGVIDVDRRGKKITNPRYMATTYGVELSGDIVCEKCGVTATISASASERASSFEEQV